jgi:hypothetical protein
VFDIALYKEKVYTNFVLISRGETMAFEVRSFLALILVGTVTTLMAGAPAIGVARASGDFRVDQAGVHGNSTLFDGTTVETGKVLSELQLQGGAKVILAADSRGKVYRDRIVLEKGAGQLKAAGAYGVEALGLRVLPDAAGSTFKVALNRSNHLEVAALHGTVHVANAQGVVVASLGAGRTLDLDPQAGAAAASQLTGCLQKKNGKYILTDETTNVTVELQGAGLEKEVGNKIEITGAMIPGATPAAGTSQVIKVANFNRVSKGCGISPAAAAAAGGAAAGGAAAGISGTTIAIIGGVGATAATVGGLFAARDVLVVEEQRQPVEPELRY